MWYKIDFYKWAINKLPLSRRKPKFIAFVKTLVSEIKTMQNEFEQKRKEDEFILNHNGQVCYLRAALNKKFDRTLNRIVIGNGNKYKRQYIYTNAEQKPKYLGKIYIKNRSDYADTRVNFIVYVPKEILEKKTPEIHALISIFKAAHYTYKLEIL